MGKISKAISRILCGVLIIGAVAGSSSALYLGGKNNGWFDEFKKPEIEQSQPENGGETITENGELVVTPNESMTSTAKAVRLAVMPMAASVNDGISTLANTGVSKIIRATVSAEIENPKLDWTVETASGGTTTAITVTPSADTLSATVTCTAAFDGVIYVKATLRDIGVTATASVIFEGVPTSLAVSSANLTNNDNYFSVNAKGDYTIDIALDNVFGVVGSKYSGTYVVNTVKHGSINVRDFSYNIGTGSGTYGTTSVKNFSSLDMSYMNSQYGYSEFVNISVAGSHLNVKVNGAIGSYLSGASMSGLVATQQNAFYSINEDCYYLVTITDIVNNLSVSLKVGFGSAMLSTVTFDTPSMIF